MSLSERQSDFHSLRRSRLDRERRAEFDRHYGKQKADGTVTRNHGGAGKGDADRISNRRAYEIGYELATREDLTDGERERLTAEWKSAVRRERTG
jgi:hypothetical protein